VFEQLKLTSIGVYNMKLRGTWTAYWKGTTWAGMSTRLSDATTDHTISVITDTAMIIGTK
jgi:hypothetical protein